MFLQVFLVGLYFAFLNDVAHSFIFAPKDPLGPIEPVTARTQMGDITGRTIKTTFYGTTGKVKAFLGIPYAEPPTGTRRFRKTVMKTNLTAPFKAQKLGPACPQDLFIMDGWVPGRKFMDEDCLTINVYVPNKGNSPGNFSVMVWIYGGAFVIGQSSIYSAENLTLVSDTIVVTFNYRVSAFGFLSTNSSRYPGNLGLWDQLLALQWIQAHIADFGGDPNRITVFGNSAGASSILLHSLYPGSKGLFHRLIAQSGSPICPWSFQTDPAIYARRFANKLGCMDKDLDTAIDCLQTKDFMTVANNTRVATREEGMFRAEWVPSIDGTFVPKDPRQMFENALDSFRQLDYLVGVSSNDGAVFPSMGNPPNFTVSRETVANYFIPSIVKDLYGQNITLIDDWFMFVYTDWEGPDHDYSEMTKEYLKLSGDFTFFMPALKTLFAHARSPKQSKSYLYEFDLRPSYTDKPAWVAGSNHGDELPFVFGFPDSMADGMRFGGHVPDYEKQVSKNMMIMWSNFAKSG